MPKVHLAKPHRTAAGPVWAASLMCADPLHLADELDKLQEAGLDRWHYDVMDGHFVPNLTMGPDLLSRIREYSPLPIDVHLMVERPEDWVPIFARAGAHRIYFHVESTRSPHRLAQLIRELGCEPAVAINAATPLAVLESLVPLVEGVLFMTVDPGFAGQPLITSVTGKIETFLRTGIADRLSVGADGHIDPETARTLVGLGVDHLVLGTASLFRRDRTYIEAMRRLRAILDAKEEPDR